jgi:hypothetical protein
MSVVRAMNVKEFRPIPVRTRCSTKVVVRRQLDINVIRGRRFRVCNPFRFIPQPPPVSQKTEYL